MLSDVSISQFSSLLARAGPVLSQLQKNNRKNTLILAQTHSSPQKHSLDTSMNMKPGQHRLDFTYLRQLIAQFERAFRCVKATKNHLFDQTLGMESDATKTERFRLVGSSPSGSASGHFDGELEEADNISSFRQNDKGNTRFSVLSWRSGKTCIKMIGSGRNVYIGMCFERSQIGTKRCFEVRSGTAAPREKNADAIKLRRKGMAQIDSKCTDGRSSTPA